MSAGQYSRSTIGHSVQLEPEPTADSESDPPTPRTIRHESKIKVGFLVVAPIIGYLSMAIAISAVLTSVLHTHQFRTSSTDDIFELSDGQIIFLPFSQGLRQSDVVTLVSLASTLTRLLGGFCCGIACWRAVYILLEREGLSLADVDGLVSHPFLRPWPLGTYRIIISCFALLFLSAELYSPILNGSITWESKARTIADGELLQGVPQGTSEAWSWRIIGDYQHTSYLYRSAVHVTTALVGGRGETNGSHHTDLWRVIPRDLPINSTLANITLPFFVVDSFEWIADPANMVDPTTLGALGRNGNLLNFTSPINPMFGAVTVGDLALIPKTPFDHTDNTSLQRTIDARDYYVALIVGFGAAVRCIRNAGDWSQYVPLDIEFYFTAVPRYGENERRCIAFARISLRAGAGRCVDCRITSRFTVRNESDIELQGDYMTESVFHMMPEVSKVLTALSSTLLSPQIVGLDRYIIDALTQAYCGAWTSLTDYAGALNSTVQTEVRLAVQVSQAMVSQPRVIAWLVLNICIALCCAAIVLIQAATGKRRVLIDATLAAVLLDASEVVDSLRTAGQDSEKGRERRDICNMSLLFDDEKDTRSRKAPYNPA
ncbi:hypothetical protein FRC17_009459 [Serendipita sp. 399]|nr:hypothetical protein FRC17_009459 [Serendipita sp. 399]